MEKNIYDLQIKVLLSKDEGAFVAHALEMDLVSYGKTEKEALNELDNLIRNQISFAIAKGDDSLIFFNAPQEYFKEWDKAHGNVIKGIIGTERRAALKNVRAVAIGFTKQDIDKIKKSSRNRRFDLSPIACA